MRGRGLARRARAARALALAALVALPACARAQSPAAPGPTRTDTVSLRRVLDSLATAHQGVVGYAVRNVETGEQLALRGDETFPTASLVKVPILVTVYDLVAKGALSLDDRLTMLRIDQVGGSGVLQFMHAGLELTVGDAAALMVILSDNTATNLLLDRVAIRRVWEKMEALGLPHTKVHSKTFLRMSSVAMDSSVKYGLGVSTPSEMARLFALLAEGKAVNRSADSAMLALLEKNQTWDKLGRLTGTIRSARKSGEVDESRSECALFWLPQRVVTCVFTKQNSDKSWRIDNDAQVMIAKMGEAIVRAWSPRKPPS